MTPKQQPTAGAMAAEEIMELAVNVITAAGLHSTTHCKIKWSIDSITLIIDKHTAARLIVPEPSEKVKQEIEGLEAHAAKRDKFEAESTLLFDLIKMAGLHARHCDNCSEYILKIVKKARTAIANAETEKQEEG